MKRLQFSIRGTLLSVLLIAVVLGAFFAVRERLQNRIIVVNESGQTIDEIDVQINDFDMRAWFSLRPGERVTSTFVPLGDSHFDIFGRLADGTQFEVPDSYATSGTYGIRFTISIGPDGVVRADGKG